jgi:alkylation response protein AidB-like acyl-CoA dehydrogenase
MDFAFGAAETAFAEEVRRFLREHPVERFPLDGMDAGYGSGAHSRAFMQALAGRGWISMCWPEAFGGRACPMFFKLVLFEELALAGAPFGPLAGSWQTADAIIEYGTERLRREVLPAVARGEATFWQGYSEPDAGSDLLARHARARLLPHQPRGAAQPWLQHVRGAQRHPRHGHPADHEPDRRRLSLRGLPRRRPGAGRADAGPRG